MMHPHDLKGRGVVGMPGSEILAVSPLGDDWAGNGVTWILQVRLCDGRMIDLPKTIRAYGDPTHGTFERRG